MNSIRIDKKEKSDFEPIIVDIKKSQKKLNLKLRKTKGKIVTNLPINKEISEEAYQIYLKAKNLPPTPEIPNPYWNLYFLISPFNLFSSKNIKYDKFHTSNMEWLEDVEKKSNFSVMKKVQAYTSISGVLNYLFYDFFNQYSNIKKQENSLFISNVLHLSSIEEYTVFREKNSFYSYKDNITFLELPYYNSEEKELTSPLIRDKFKKTFSKIDYQIIPENICNLENLTLQLNESLDIVIIDTNYFLWKIKKYHSHVNSQVLFNLIIYSLNNLKKGGLMKLGIRELDSKILFDIIQILSYYFKKVYIKKSPLQNITQPYKNLVCENFQGIEIKELKNLIEISNEWNKIEEKCSIDLRGIQTDNYYVSSILENNNNFEEIKTFNNLEITKKIKYFNLIVNVYYDIQICSSKVYKKYLERKLANTIYYLKLNNIPVKTSYNKTRKKIIEGDFSVNNSNIFTTGKLEKHKLKNTNIEIKDRNYDLENLYKIENNLKFTKRILDTLEYKRYKKTTNYTKKYGDKILILKDIIYNKYLGYDVSQAFLKLYEIYEKYNIIPDKKSTYKTFHFCEFPGQFILSTNYYISSKTQIEDHQWTGQSLNPRSGKNEKYRKQKIFGDTYGLYQNYPENWDFGVDNSGDITKIKNMKYYKKYLQEVDLVTSDCGLDMTQSTKAVYQDKEMSYINFCQILMVLHGLKKGSHYISKVFLPQTTNYIVGLNYIMSSCFEEFYIHKSSLNIGSSEVYLVCKKFLGIDEKITEQLFEIKKKLKIETSFVDVPDNFLKEYSEKLSIFVQNQINYIERNIFYYENPLLFVDEKEILKVQKDNSKKWIEYYNFK